MKNKASEYSYNSLIVSMVFSAIILLACFVFVDGFTFGVCFRKLLIPVSRLILFIGMGLVVAQIIEETGWTRHLAALARPLFRFGNMGEYCSAAFTAAFFSGVSSNAMLLEFFKENRITKKQLFLANFMNQTPAYFLHLPATFFMILPLTGIAGVYYLLLTFSALILRTTAFLIYGHFQPMDIADGENKIEPRTYGKKGRSSMFKEIREKLPARMLNITIYVLPVYILMYVANALGLFNFINDLFSSYVVTRIVPAEALTVVALSFASEFTSGFAAAGSLMDAGVITVQQTVIALLIGNILAFPIRAVRHQLPRYVGIYSPKMGTQLLLMGQGFRITSLIMVGVIYYYLSGL